MKTSVGRLGGWTRPDVFDSSGVCFDDDVKKKVPDHGFELKAAEERAGGVCWHGCRKLRIVELGFWWKKKRWKNLSEDFGLVR